MIHRSPSNLDPPSLPATLRLVQKATSPETWVRLICGIVAAIASIWLLLVEQRTIPILLSAAGLVFSALWIARFVRSRSQGQQGPSALLELDQEGIILENRGERTAVVWKNVCRIEQDQDALMVCVVRNDGTELRIDPEFGGLGLEALSQLIYGFLRRSRTCNGQDKG